MHTITKQPGKARWTNRTNKQDLRAVMKQNRRNRKVALYMVGFFSRTTIALFVVYRLSKHPKTVLLRAMENIKDRLGTCKINDTFLKICLSLLDTQTNQDIK